MDDSELSYYGYVDRSCQWDGPTSLSPVPLVQSGITPFAKS